MPRTETQTRQLFDEWAASYDADLIEASGPLLGYTQSVAAIDGSLPIEGAARVLDVGTGSGTIAARFAGQGAHITGIDPSARMLGLCREQHPDFALSLGTFNDIPLADATFDAVVSGFAFHETFLPTRGAVCAEIARVLKPGGCLCLLDIMFASDAAMQAAREHIGAGWDDDEDYAIVGELDTLLRQAGFTALRWTQTAPFHWLVTARKGEGYGI